MQADAHGRIGREIRTGEKSGPARISVRSWPCRRFAAPAESIQRAMLCELCACQPKLAGARRAKVGALRSKGFLSVSESLWWSVFVTFVPFVPS